MARHTDGDEIRHIVALPRVLNGARRLDVVNGQPPVERR